MFYNIPQELAIGAAEEATDSSGVVEFGNARGANSEMLIDLLIVYSQSLYVCFIATTFLKNDGI